MTRTLSTITTLLTLVAGVATAGAAEPFKVGVVHLGSVTDGGYNQAHGDGIQAMKKSLPDVEVIQVENVPEGADAERVMENMIKRGARVIFAASFGYLEPAMRVAQKYPDV